MTITDGDLIIARLKVQIDKLVDKPRSKTRTPRLRDRFSHSSP